MGEPTVYSGWYGHPPNRRAFGSVEVPIYWADDNGSGPDGPRSGSRAYQGRTRCEYDSDGELVGECSDSISLDLLRGEGWLNSDFYDGVETIVYTISAWVENDNVDENGNPIFNAGAGASVTVTISKPAPENR